MYKYFSLLLIVFVGLQSRAQKLNVSVNYVAAESLPANNAIDYQSSRPLSWADFKGKPVENSDAAAITNAGFGVSFLLRRMGNNSDLVIAVNCSFSKKDSWVKTNQTTAYILNHEQRHFDIAYIHTLIFMDKLRKASYTVNNYAAVIEKNTTKRQKRWLRCRTNMTARPIIAG